MGSEQPVQSPFGRSDLPRASAQHPPAPAQPEPPRLGILHLMVLTACVAIWMGIDLGLRPRAGLDIPTPSWEAYWLSVQTVRGILQGAALTGLILFLARRLRGIPFPKWPGEYLLVILGMSVALGPDREAMYVVASLVWHDDPAATALGLARRGGYMPVMRSGAPIGWPLTCVIWTMGLGPFAVNAAVFIWALVRVRIRRWRVFFLSIPACYIAGLPLVWLMVRILQPGLMALVIQGVIPAGASVVLLVVVLKDHFDGKQYPWSHWLGVALRLSFDVVGLITLLWWTVLSWHRFF